MLNGSLLCSPLSDLDQIQTHQSFYAFPIIDMQITNLVVCVTSIGMSYRQIKPPLVVDFFLFGLMLNERHGKQFFSHGDTELPLSGYYQYFWGVNLSCSRTQQGDQSGAQTPTSGSGI